EQGFRPSQRGRSGQYHIDSYSFSVSPEPAAESNRGVGLGSRKQMQNWHSEILITTDPLLTPGKSWDGNAGATLDFWGVVRELEDGREIRGIEYEAHLAMAQHQMEMLAEAAREKFSLREV